MAKYKTKPCIIEAYQTDKEMMIHTLEGEMKASAGDYIITGLRGEKYPCKPDIFKMKYEPIDTMADSSPKGRSLRSDGGDAPYSEVRALAKADTGKPKLSLVPVEIIRCIARVREFGVEKYKDPDNWKQVEAERYRDAAFRHMLAYVEEPDGVDEESGLPHLWHLATNIAFLCEMEKGK